MATKKTLLTKQAVKQSIPRASHAKPRASAKPKAAAKPRTTKKAIDGPSHEASAAKSPVNTRTPSLVTAQPLSTVEPAIPRHPEQLLYEPDARTGVPLIEEPIAPAVAPKRRGRPPKSANATLVASVPETAVPTPRPATSTASDSTIPHVATSAVPMAAISSTAVAVPHAVSTPPVAAKQRRNQRIWRAVFGLVVVAALAAFGMFWRATHQDVVAANNALVAAVDKRAVLPRDETPSISTIIDTTKVNQEFLKNAKKGDKVLLYFQSGQAIVYRPSTGQIVNMGPLQTPRPRVFIRKGSPSSNITTIRDQISRSNQFLMVSQDQSPKNNYEKSMVIDVTGNRPDLAGQLAQLLNLPVGQLPDGETAPDADLLVIVGSDYK